MANPISRAPSRQRLQDRLTQVRLERRQSRSSELQEEEPAAPATPPPLALQQVEYSVDAIKKRRTLTLDKANCLTPSARLESDESVYPISLEVSLEYLESNQLEPTICEHIDELRILAPRSIPSSKAINALCTLHEHCGSLQRLSLHGCGEIEPRVILKLTAKPLAALDLTGCFKLSDDDVKKICESQRSLQELTLSGCSQLTVKALEFICTMTTLRSLNISRCMMNFSLLDNDPLPAKFKKLALHTLRISSPYLKDTDCLVLGPAFNHIALVDVRGCKLSYDGLRHFLGKESRITQFEYDPTSPNSLDGIFPTVLEHFLGPAQPFLPPEHAKLIATKIAHATNRLETNKKLISWALHYNLLDILQDRLIALGFHLACSVEAITLTHFKISCLVMKDRDALWNETVALLKLLFANENATCFLELHTSSHPRLEKLQAALAVVTEIDIVDDAKLTSGATLQRVTELCPNLVEAKIADFSLTNDDITTLAKSAPRLEKLHICGSAIPSIVPEALANLKRLYLENAVGLTFLSLANIWKKLPKDCQDPISEEEEEALVTSAATDDLITVILGEYPAYLQKRASEELVTRNAPPIDTIYKLLQAALAQRSSSLFTACIEWANSYFAGWIQILTTQKRATISCKVPEHTCWKEPAKRQIAANILQCLAKAYKYTLEIDGAFEACYKKELDSFLESIQGAICTLTVTNQRELKARTVQLPNLEGLKIISSPNTTDPEVDEVVGLCKSLTELTLQDTAISMVQVQRMKRPGLTITHDTLRLGTLAADAFPSLLAHAYESSDRTLVESLYTWFNKEFGEFLTIEITGDLIEPDELAIPEEVEQPEAIQIVPKIAATRVHFVKPCLDKSRIEMIKMCLASLGALDVYSPATDEFYALFQLCVASVQALHLFPANSPDCAFLAKWLQQSACLEKATMFSCKVRAADLPSVPHTHLERLELINCETVTGSMFSAMKQAFPALIHLNLAQNAHLQDNDIKQLADVFEGQLDSLDLSGCVKLTDASLISIGEKCKKLRTLRLKRTAIAIQKKIPNLRNVKRISFAGCKNLTNDSLLLFGDNERDIRTFELSDCPITSKGILQLSANSPLITRLILASCSQISDDDLRLIASAFFLLKAIDISNCNKVTEKAILALIELLPNLHSIQTQGCILLPELLRHPLQKTLNKSLDIHDGRDITDNTVKIACYFNPFLEEVTLRGHRLTDKSLEHIRLHLKNTLRRLRVVNCPGISPRTLQDLQAEMRNVEIQTL